MVHCENHLHSVACKVLTISSTLSRGRRIKHACLMLQPAFPCNCQLLEIPSLNRMASSLHLLLLVALVSAAVSADGVPERVETLLFYAPRIPHEHLLSQDQQTQPKTVLCLLVDCHSLDNHHLLRLKRDPVDSGSLWKAEEESFDGRRCDRPGHCHQLLRGYQD